MESLEVIQLIPHDCTAMGRQIKRMAIITCSKELGKYHHDKLNLGRLLSYHSYISPFRHSSLRVKNKTTDLAAKTRKGLLDR